MNINPQHLCNLSPADLNNPNFVSELQAFLRNHPNCSPPVPGIDGLIALIPGGFGQAGASITRNDIYASIAATVIASTGPHVVPATNIASVSSIISSASSVVSKSSASTIANIEEQIQKLLNPKDDESYDEGLRSKLNNLQKDPKYKSTCKTYCQAYYVLSQLENRDTEKQKKLDEVIAQIRDFFIKTETFTAGQLNGSPFALRPSSTTASVITIEAPVTVAPNPQAVIEDLIGKVKEEWAGFELLSHHFTQLHDHTITRKLEEARQSSNPQEAITELNILRAAIYFQRFCKKHQNLSSAQKPTLKPEERELYEKANQLLQTFLETGEQYVYFNSQELKNATIEVLSRAYYTLCSVDPKNMGEILDGLNSIKTASFPHHEGLLQARDQLLKGIPRYTESQVENLIQQIGRYVVKNWPHTQEEIEKEIGGKIRGQLIRCVDMYLMMVNQTPAITDYTNYAKFLKILLLEHTPKPANIIAIEEELTALVSERIRVLKAAIPATATQYIHTINSVANYLKTWPTQNLGTNVDNLELPEYLRQLVYAENYYHITPSSQLKCTEQIRKLREEYAKHYEEGWEHFNICS